jgi:hypothetical protein
MRDALPLYWEAVRVEPDFWIGYHNIMNAFGQMGNEEGVVQLGEKLIKYAGGRPAARPRNAISGSENLVVAQTEAQMHDIAAARVRLMTSPAETSNSDIAAAAFDRALLDEGVGDLRAAAKEWDTFGKAYADPTVATNNAPYMCFAALTYEKTGQPAKADQRGHARRSRKVGRRPNVVHKGYEAGAEHPVRALLVGLALLRVSSTRRWSSTSRLSNCACLECPKTCARDGSQATSRVQPMRDP